MVVQVTLSGATPPTVTGATGVAGFASDESGPPELDEPPVPVVGAEVPPPALPDVPTPPPEQELVTLGTHVKSLPQSAAVLHGSCQRYAHKETDVVVHVVSTGVTSGHLVVSAQRGTAVPPLQVPILSV